MYSHLLRLIGMLFFVFIALGSETIQETNQRKFNEAYAEQQRVISENESIKQKCLGFGFKEGTQGFAQCLQTESIVLRQKNQCSRFISEINSRIERCKWNCMSNARGANNYQVLGEYGRCSKACEQFKNEIPPACY
jgi:hypothetical protein